jgi:predicted transposase YbfD/YdcC
MEDFGSEQEEWFRGFLELPNGIPDKDTFRRVFERIKPEELFKSLQSWTQEVGASGGRKVNVDGKTIRGSRKAGEHEAFHVISAWVGEHNLVLGQLVTEEKSNEITAIPQLLDMVEVGGDIVTIDAMGCQTAIAQKIREKEADYILSVKDNQPTLHRDIQDYFDWAEGKGSGGGGIQWWRGAVEPDHGRIEQREVGITGSLDWLEGKDAWKDIKSIIRYRCTHFEGEQPCSTDRYYISSLQASAEQMGAFIRSHWSIENHLHWSLDVLWGEDACRIRKAYAPLNMNILRKIALARLKEVDTGGKKLTIHRRMFKASVNPQFLHTVLFGK